MKAPLRQTNVMTREQWRAFIEYRRVMGLDGEYKVVLAPAEVGRGLTMLAFAPHKT